MNQWVPHQRVIQVVQGALGLCGNGQQGGLRHSRNDVDVDEPRSPLVIENEVGAREIAQPESGVNRDSRRFYLLDDRLVQPSRHEVLRTARVVPCIEVILPVGDDLNRGKCAWPLSCVDDGDRQLRPGDVALDEGALVVGEARHHRGAQLVRRRCVGDTKSGAPLMRLHHDRKSQMTRHDGENLLSPQLTEIGLWKRQ